MGKYFIPTFNPIQRHMRVFKTLCMYLKTEKLSRFSTDIVRFYVTCKYRFSHNYTSILCNFFTFFNFKLFDSPLPVIGFKFDFNKFSDIAFIDIMLIKHIKKKADRFLSNTKNIHNFTSIHLLLYRPTGFLQVLL